MREAVEAVLTFAFDTMALSVVCAFPESVNARSIQLLERLHFELRPDLLEPDEPTCVTYVLFRSG